MGHDLISAVNSVVRVLSDEQQADLNQALQAALQEYEMSECMPQFETEPQYQDSYCGMQEAWARGDANAVSSFIEYLECCGWIWKAE